VFVTLILALVLITSLRPRFYLTPAPSLVFWVPFLSHFYLLGAGLVSGVILNPPVLLAMALAMLIIAFYLHRPTIHQILYPKTRSTG